MINVTISETGGAHYQYLVSVLHIKCKVKLYSYLQTKRNCSHGNRVLWKSVSKNEQAEVNMNKHTDYTIIGIC